MMVEVTQVNEKAEVRKERTGKGKKEKLRELYNLKKYGMVGIMDLACNPTPGMWRQRRRSREFKVSLDYLVS